MKFYLSTLADISMDESNPDSPSIINLNRTLPLALEYGLGLEVAEYCIAENLDANRAATDAVVWKKSSKVSELLLHAPFNELTPCAIDTRAAHLASFRYQQALDAASQINAKKLIVHAGYIPTVYYRDFFISQSIKFWNTFFTEFQPQIEICLENVMEYEPEMLVEIIEGVNNERLKLCLDIGHANLTPTTLSHWLNTELPYLSHFHIHNNKGIDGKEEGSSGDLHAPLDNGIIDYESILNLISIEKPEATLTVECWDVCQCTSWLRDHSFI